MFPFFNPSIDNSCMTPSFCSKAFLNGWNYADETWKFHTGELNIFEIFANAPQVTLRLEAEADPAAIWTEADSSALGFFFEAGFDYHRQRRKKSDAHWVSEMR